MKKAGDVAPAQAPLYSAFAKKVGSTADQALRAICSIQRTHGTESKVGVTPQGSSREVQDMGFYQKTDLVCN